MVLIAPVVPVVVPIAPVVPVAPVEVFGSNVELFAVEASLRTSVDTSTDVVPEALRNSGGVCGVGSGPFVSAVLVPGRGTLCRKRFSSTKRLIGPSPLNP